MGRFTQTTSNIQTSLLHGAMIGAFVAALTMSPTDARAHGWSFSNGELAVGFLFVSAEIASGVVLISDGIGLLDEPKPTAWNAGWDIALAMPNAFVCVAGWTSFNPQDDCGGQCWATARLCAAELSRSRRLSQTALEARLRPILGRGC
jgi:hypothetical protein